MNIVIKKWHDRLAMPKYDIDWHKRDIEDEFQELVEARGVIAVWSEMSDVAYTYTRAHWSGHSELTLPISRLKYISGLLYMFPKYSLRWKFFNELGNELGSKKEIREVRNPKKVEKLKVLANNYEIDPEEFVALAKKKMKRRIFLK